MLGGMVLLEAVLRMRRVPPPSLLFCSGRLPAAKAVPAENWSPGGWAGGTAPEGAPALGRPPLPLPPPLLVLKLLLTLPECWPLAEIGVLAEARGDGSFASLLSLSTLVLPLPLPFTLTFMAATPAGRSTLLLLLAPEPVGEDEDDAGRKAEGRRMPSRGRSVVGVVAGSGVAGGPAIPWLVDSKLYSWLTCVSVFGLEPVRGCC